MCGDRKSSGNVRGFPLALVQAGREMHEMETSCSRYLRHYNTSWSELQADRGVTVKPGYLLPLLGRRLKVEGNQYSEPQLIFVGEPHVSSLRVGLIKCK